MSFPVNFLWAMLTEPIFRRSVLMNSPRFASYLPNYFKNLPQTTSTARYSKLHIILRANDAVISLSSNRQLEKIGLRTKLDVIQVCARSLATATQQFSSEFGSDNVSVTIVNDNLSDQAKEMIKKFFIPPPPPPFAHNHESVPRQSISFVSAARGNAPTFLKQIFIASKDSLDTLVAICEDDYLFDKSVFTTAFKLFNTTPRLEGFTPHNHPNIIRLCQPTHIYKLSGQFYQYSPTTTCTFFAGADLIRKCFKLFSKYNGKEEKSINKVWKNHICISPCCWTLAEHLHLNDLSPVQTLIADKRKP